MTAAPLATACWAFGHTWETDGLCEVCGALRRRVLASAFEHPDARLRLARIAAGIGVDVEASGDDVTRRLRIAGLIEIDHSSAIRPTYRITRTGTRVLSGAA